MNKTLIVYDLSGTIIQQITGFYQVPNGVPYLEIEIQQGKRPISVNIETKEVIYEDIPPSDIEVVQDKISILEGENKQLKLEQEQQNEEILVNMLANTEMFEMLLGMIPMTLSTEDKKTKNSGGSSMIEVYCTLIIKGVKTIEDVPLVIREQVIERLKQLEVPVK